MKRRQFYILLALSIACLVVAMELFLQGRSLNRLQVAYRQQEDFLARSAQARQILQNLLSDLAQLSSNNARVKELLARHGYKVNQPADAVAISRPPGAAGPVSPAPSQIPPATPK